MAEQTPAPGAGVPDPSRSYERAKPEAESGMGRLNNSQGTPSADPDRMEQAVEGRQRERQTNTHEVTDQRDERQPTDSEPSPGHLPPPEEPDHSMMEEEPNGWDQAPADIRDPRQKRHSRTEGKGGLP